MMIAVSKSTWQWIPCMAHTLQLVITNAKKENLGLDDVLSKVRAIAGHYKRSSKARSSLSRWQKQRVLQHELIQDVEMRWNSEYHMMERLLEQQESIAAHLVSKAVETLNSSEWSLVAGIVKILEPIDQATIQLCSDKYPSLSLKSPLIYEIQSVLERHREKRNTEVVSCLQEVY
ncbi:hypothetical protein PR048_017443 [Dryococelus australis]|uniref:Transposase n=1 Tax=Dryococelus australis TaxID=614101 RepID=A0ABQ9H9L4_9NEOP|nr:hypothetical protein PR048_017443 [Dryococelus australis]